MLAADELALTIGGERLFLRPTLRAALRLERRHGGFNTLARSVADGSVTVIADVIREGAGVRSPDLVDQILAAGLRNALETLQEPIFGFVLALTGIEEADANLHQAKGNRDKENTDREQITFAEHHGKLFRIATGWLGYTPAEAWDSTPAEILEAYQGRVELLNAIFGGESKPTPDNLSIDDKVRFAMASLGARKEGE